MEGEGVTVKEFLQWYEEKFPGQHVDEEYAVRMAYYIYGMRDTHPEHSVRYVQLTEVGKTLEDAATMIKHLRIRGNKCDSPAQS